MVKSVGKPDARKRTSGLMSGEGKRATASRPRTALFLASVFAAAKFTFDLNVRAFPETRSEFSELA
jgi:hypothetical protein